MVRKDKRLVHHLSTLNQPDDIQPAQRCVGASVIHLNQPAAVHSYNKHMSGVDQHDQLRMNYSVGRNSKKWWPYLFWFFVNCAIVNSFLMYKETSLRWNKKKKYTHLDYRIELAEGLIEGFSRRKRKASEMDSVCLVNAENISVILTANYKDQREGAGFFLNFDAPPILTSMFSLRDPAVLFIKSRSAPTRGDVSFLYFRVFVFRCFSCVMHVIILLFSICRIILTCLFIVTHL